jgi:nucleoside-diphosphate-sugar epimerase
VAKVLLLGGTGAMGVYLVPELINLGFDVVVTSRSVRKSDNDKLTYIQGNAHNDAFIEKILANNEYDAIVDFMVYTMNEFRHRYESLLKSVKHYIFLSSTRVFARSEQPITEKSPRLLDVSDDYKYLSTDDYNLTKARQENILRESQYKNWSIVRPGLVYSKTRLPLGTLETDTIIFRTLCKCPVVLPQEMLQKHSSMTWGGDVAKMIARLVLNPNAFSEDFNVVSHKRNTWEEVALYYEKFIGLTVIPTSLDVYIKMIGGKSQTLSARMNDRVLDNSKILKATGIEKESITSIHDGFAIELKQLPPVSKIDYALNAQMDRITHSRISLEKASTKEKFVYYIAYIGIYTFLKNVKTNFIK